MYVYIYIYMYMCVYIYIHIHIHIHTYTFIEQSSTPGHEEGRVLGVGPGGRCRPGRRLLCYIIT